MVMVMVMVMEMEMESVDDDEKRAETFDHTISRPPPFDNSSNRSAPMRLATCRSTLDSFLSRSPARSLSVSTRMSFVPSYRYIDASTLADVIKAQKTETEAAKTGTAIVDVRGSHRQRSQASNCKNTC